jgi:hypothetical protein
MTDRDSFRARIRMYRQGLGDCFLVTFRTREGLVHAVIDCGTLGTKSTPEVTMEKVVANIVEQTGNHLHLLIATHEHKDHVSGFGTQEKVWKAMEVDHVWAAWTENAKDPAAQAIRKHKGDLLEAVALAARALDRVQGDDDELAAVGELREGMAELLGFFDDLPAADDPFPGLSLAKTVNEAMSWVTGAGKKGVQFLEPGQVVEPEWLPGFRVYVLGPPRSEAALRNMGGHESPELYHAAGGVGGELAAAIRFGETEKSFPVYREELEGEARQAFERRLPFDPRFRVETVDEVRCGERFPAYYEKENAWRRIDADWLTGAGELALQLDSYTNNTSLVLAVEIIPDGRVLLFAADAQLGNWLSWHDHTFRFKEADGTERTVTAEELLRRTVFYKVGHHASHNATARERGLELMERDDLVAMIALDHEVAIRKRPHPWHMPADALYRRLIERTMGRVLRSDIGWAEEEVVRRVFGPDPDRVQEALDARARADQEDVEIDPLFVDLFIR